MDITRIYIDGFNLYYGALKRTPFRWLNPLLMCSHLLPKLDIQYIKYFTARVRPRGNPQKPVRQQTYFRALNTIPNFEIIFGHFLSHKISMPLAECPPKKQEYVTVIKTEEKGSDVNMASHLINDGYKGLYDVAILVTNDSDLVEPIRIVRDDLGLKVGILNPHSRASRSLVGVASFNKTIRQGVLRSSQFPDVLVDANGTINKPISW